MEVNLENFWLHCQPSPWTFFEREGSQWFTTIAARFGYRLFQLLSHIYEF